MRYSKLRGRIREKCGTQEHFANLIGMNPSSLSLRLNNRTEWSREEIVKSAHILGISFLEIGEYFFADEVEKHQHNLH